MEAFGLHPVGRAIPVEFRADTGQVFTLSWLPGDQSVPWFPADEVRVVRKTRVEGFGPYSHLVSTVDTGDDSRANSYWLVRYLDSARR